MLRDLLDGWRALAAAPVLSAVVVASLAIGIGVNTAVFSWIEVFALSPLPGVPRASEFHLIEPRTEAGAYPGASWLEFQDLRADLGGTADLLAFRMAPLNVGEAARTERVFSLLVSDGYFQALGVRPELGRLLEPGEVTTPGASPVAVVSHRFWQTRLAADPAAVGRALRVNGVDLAVVGVLPDGFQGTVLGLQFDLWVPATMAPVILGGSRELEDRRSRGYTMMARLPRDGQVAAVAQAAAASMRTLAETYPETNRGVGVEVLPYWRAPRGPQRMFLQALGVLQGLMLVLLLAVCGNTATLLLSRAASRRRELAIRLAVGASPWRVARLVLAESLVVGLLGAVAGAMLAAWGVRALQAVPLTTGLPIRFQTSVDAVALAVALGLGLVSALVVALPTAIQLLRLDVSAEVAAAARAAATGRWRSVAMAAEVALAMVVLVIAGLFLGTFADTRDTHPGFERQGVLLAAYDRSGRGGDDADALAFARRALDGLGALPGVQGAAIATSVPLDIHGLAAAGIRARRAGADRRRGRPGGVQRRHAGLLRGDGDALGGGRRPGAARRPDHAAAGGGEPGVRRPLPALRRRHRPASRAGRSHLHHQRRGRDRRSPTPSVSRRRRRSYFSYRDRPSRSGELHVRTRPGAEATVGGPLRATIGALDPASPVFNLRTLDEHVENNLLLKRIPARLFLVLGPLLLLLAAGGIHAVVAYAVSARRTEIGVRLALGATGRRVVGELVSSSLGVVAAGAAAGWLVVWIVATRLFGAPTDVRAFVAVPLTVIAVAAVSSWLPARHAASIDPVAALKHD